MKTVTHKYRGWIIKKLYAGYLAVRESDDHVAPVIYNRLGYAKAAVDDGSAALTVKEYREREEIARLRQELEAGTITPLGLQELQRVSGGTWIGDIRSSAAGKVFADWQKDNHYERLGRRSDIKPGEPWEINADLFQEFLGVLPPLVYRGNHFLLREYSMGSITTHYWCDGPLEFGRFYCEFYDTNADTLDLMKYAPEYAQR